MKKIIVLLLACSTYVVAPAQNIVAAEYFIDTDPGVGSGVTIAVPSPGTTVNLTASVPTTALSAGFHTVAIRTRDANGVWSLFETRSFYISTTTTDVGIITEAEYFIDTDPGRGNGIALSIGAAGNTVSFTAPIPTTALAPGFHFLSIRTRSADGSWSLFEKRGFYITSSSTNVGIITQAEYFIDADPGTGAGTPVSVGAIGNAVNFSVLIPTTSLSAGFHTLAIRTLSIDGVWSLFENRAFYITTTNADVGPVNAAEFFIDTDPGAGNGTALAIGASGNTISFTAPIPTTSLSTGFHTLAIRTRRNDGVWSLFENRMFYISSTATDMGAVATAEYFIDSDPGAGNGAPLVFTPSGNNVSQSFVATVPAGTSQGLHRLVVRSRDANGVWSLFEARDFTVAGSLPLDFLSFTGRKVNEKVALQWQTENENNTSHFDVERSSNGVQFTRIGQVTSRNMPGQQNYASEDATPLKGLNLYRLKQVDRDGAFKYSAIINVYFGDGDSEDLKLFPQPAQSYINLVFGGNGSALFIQVYDAAGKMVINERKQNNTVVRVETSTLARGSYWLIVSDGVTRQKGQFIKQ
jgi:hypothetical protein